MCKVDTLVQDGDYDVGVALAERPGPRCIDALQAPLVGKQGVVWNDGSCGRRAYCGAGGAFRATAGGGGRNIGNVLEKDGGGSLPRCLGEPARDVDCVALRQRQNGVAL